MILDVSDFMIINRDNHDNEIGIMNMELHREKGSQLNSRDSNMDNKDDY